MENKRQLLKYRGTSCLNCHQSLDKSELYCHHCGQLNSTKRLSFEDFFNEFFSGIFAYDSRLYRTLGALLFKPGKISKDYIEGKRQRYANPYKFYLSVSIIFFIFWGMFSSFGVQAPENAEESLEQAVARDSPGSSGILDLVIPPSKSGSYSEVFIPETRVDSMAFWPASLKKVDIFSRYHEQTQIRDPRQALEGMGYRESFYNRWLYDKTVDVQNFEPETFIRYLLGKLPFIIFFFLPVFALGIWLLYLRRPYTYMEHLVFTFHNQTVLFVLFGLGFAINNLFGFSWGPSVAGFAFLLYLYKAMRHFYRQSSVKTFLKFLILNGLFFILAIIAGVFSVLASFAIF